MARRKTDAPIDLTKAHALTAGLIAALRCPDDKEQSFLRDARTKGLRVRVTAAGAKSYVFESKVNGKTLRRTIGDAEAWTIEAARTEANRLRVLVDQKMDPREVERQQADEAQMESDYLALKPLEQAVLWRMLELGARFRPYDADALGFYNDKTGDKVTVAKAQKALESLRSRQPSLIWKSARSEYTVEDAAMPRWYAQRVDAGTWPPVGPQLDGVDGVEE